MWMEGMGKMKRGIKNVTVVGAGLMGHGIALDFASSGYEVYLHSRTVTSLRRAMSNIKANLQQLSALGKSPTLSIDKVLANSVTTRNVEASVVSDDLVMETEDETSILKKTLSDQMNMSRLPDAILACNTSPLPLASFISFHDRADKILTMHF